MNKFLATLDRLSSEFADDLVQAVRHTPVDEIYRLLGREKPAPVAPPPAVVAKLVKAPVVARVAKTPPAKASPVAKAPVAKAPVAKAPVVAPPKASALTRGVVIRRPAAAAPLKAADATAHAPKSADVADVVKAAPAARPTKLAAMTAYAEQQVRRFFQDSGRRGATVQQVQRHLEHDESDPRVGQLLVGLAREGIIKDAGFRRTTGNGTQPVYVVVPQS